MSTSRTIVQRILGAASACALLMGLGAVTQEAAAGISNTRHNLSSVGPALTPARNQTATTSDLCVFCHTPHGADNTAPPPGTIRPPLWNKLINTATTYTTYPTGNLDGEVLGTVGSVSVACLSCHDGTQAMDNIINAPGSGDRIASGGGPGGRTNYTWTGGGVNNTGTMVQRTPDGAAMLGTDLSDDHPIGVQYCGGFGTAGNQATGLCRDRDFAEPTQVVNSPAFYVDTPTNRASGALTVVGQRDKFDMWLYNRTFPGRAVTSPSVECGSCHDPHTEAQVTGQVSFLRVSNAGSNLCLVCHAGK